MEGLGERVTCDVGCGMFLTFFFAEKKDAGSEKGSFCLFVCSFFCFYGFGLSSVVPGDHACVF